MREFYVGLAQMLKLTFMPQDGNKWGNNSPHSFTNKAK